MSASPPTSDVWLRRSELTLGIADCKVALPAGVAEIGLRQPLSDGEAVAVGLERAGKVALRHLHAHYLPQSGHIQRYGPSKPSNWSQMGQTRKRMKF